MRQQRWKEKTARCAAPNGHSYDIARQGYVHLLPVKQMHAKIPGDTKQMVDARRVFLSGGYYERSCDKLAGADRTNICPRTALFWTQAAARVFTLRLYMKNQSEKRFGFRRGHLEIRGKSGCGQI